VKNVKPDSCEDDFLIIDASLDPSIFPEGISPGLNVLSPEEQGYYEEDGYDDYPEIDLNEFRDHI
jgi:hypothetical protein